jgi:hypothetical protein
LICRTGFRPAPSPPSPPRLLHPTECPAPGRCLDAVQRTLVLALSWLPKPRTIWPGWSLAAAPSSSLTLARVHLAVPVVPLGPQRTWLGPLGPGFTATTHLHPVGTQDEGRCARASCTPFSPFSGSFSTPPRRTRPQPRPLAAAGTAASLIPSTPACHPLPCLPTHALRAPRASGSRAHGGRDPSPSKVRRCLVHPCNSIVAEKEAQPRHLKDHAA